MSATAVDFIAASGFTLRDDVVKDASIINITNPRQNSVPTPPTTIIGSRVKITGADTDYYRITNAVVGRIVAGGMDWANVALVPKVARAYTAGDSVSFEPYAATKAAFPTFTVKQHAHLAVALLNFFEMVGGKASDLTFTAHPGGSAAQFTVHGTTLRIDGRTQGAVSCTVAARDRAQGVVTQTLAVVVAHENRRPTSVKALGDPTIGVGATAVYDLDDYFRDPDGDVLAYTVSGENANVTATFQGNEMTVSALGQDSVDLLVDATDPDGLDVSQQMTVTVPMNRRPVRVRHVDPVAIAIGGATVLRPISGSFSDPDGGRLSWLAQWEEGDPAKQWRQEFWHVTSKTGSNRLAMESLFEYPTAVPPWGTGAPWKAPAGTDFVWRNDSPVVRTTGTLLSEATATWDATAKKVNLYIRSATGLTPSVAPPSRVLLGIDADVAWIEGDQQGDMNFLPGDVPGSRTAYVEVWDHGGLFASDLFPVALGNGPVGVTTLTMTLFAGETKNQILSQMFSDADGDKLTYSVSWFTSHIVAFPVIDGDVLVIHGVTSGVAQIGIRAVDPIGLAATGSITVTVHESAVASLPPLISSRYYVDRITALIKNEGAWGTYDVPSPNMGIPFPDSAFEFVNQAFYYPFFTPAVLDLAGKRINKNPGLASVYDDLPGHTVRLYAFFGSGDPPRFPADYIWRIPSNSVGYQARYRQEYWHPWQYHYSDAVRVVPQFKAPQVPGVYPPKPGTIGPDWSLLPMPLAGDRFYYQRGPRSLPDGVIHGKQVLTVVSVDRGQVLEVPINNPTSWVIIWDLTLDKEESDLPRPGDGSTRNIFNSAAPIRWLPREGASKQVPISVLPRNKLPRDLFEGSVQGAPAGYFESEVVLIEAAASSDVVKLGLIIKLGNDKFKITNASRRYYRGTPLFWEVLLKPNV